MKVQLSHTGSSNSSLQIQPRYRMRNTGDTVEGLDEITFRFPDQDSHFLFGSIEYLEVRMSKFLDFCRIGCLVISTPSSLKKSRSLVIETIFFCFFYCRQQHRQPRQRGKFVNTLSIMQEPGSLSISPNRSVPAIITLFDTADDTPTFIIYLKVRFVHPSSGSQIAINGADLCLEKQPRDNHLDSNSIWILESKSHVGGIGTWDTSFRFRHLNSTKYICTTKDDGQYRSIHCTTL